MELKRNSEEYWEVIDKAKQDFYIEYSKLVNRTLKSVPEECRNELRGILSEQSNPYSSDDSL